MANWAEEAFAPIEAHYKREVFKSTWGNLAPIKNKQYKGYILFCVSVYQSGTHFIINSEFGELEDSPWFYDSMHEFIYSLKLQEGGVYRFNGCVKNYAFKGSVSTIVNPQPK